MVAEHHNRGHPSHFLADTFRMATWGTGLAAIASGFLGDASVKGMGLLAPFNLAIGVRWRYFAKGRKDCCNYLLGLARRCFVHGNLARMWITAVQSPLGIDTSAFDGVAAKEQILAALLVLRKRERTPCVCRVEYVARFSVCHVLYIMSCFCHGRVFCSKVYYCCSATTVALRLRGSVFYLYKRRLEIRRPCRCRCRSWRSC